MRWRWMVGEIIQEVRLTKPFWTISFIVVGIALIGVAILTRSQPLAVRLMLCASVLIILVVIPDIRAFYGKEGIKVTFGPGGIWKIRIPRDEVTLISIIEFNPMRDFGGWGIKAGRLQYRGVLMIATTASGNRGLFIETVRGKKYVIGHRDLEGTLGMLGELYPVESGVGSHNVTG